MNKIIYNIIYIGVTLTVVSCSSKQPDNVASTVYPVTKLVARDTFVNQEYISDIHAFRKTEIRTHVQGYLEEIYVDEGQEVKKDQLLFKINPEEYRAALAGAKATLASAKAEARTAELEYDRVKILVDKEVVSPTDLDLARAKREAFQAKVDEAAQGVARAELKVTRTAIRAPFDGTIDRIPFKVGSLIDEGGLLTTLSDVRFIYAYFEVSEKEYLRYLNANNNKDGRGVNVELLLADGALLNEKGKIETMEGEFENTTGTIAFRALFPNPDKILKHGASGKVRWATAVKDALMVPQKSTVEIQDKTFVYVVDKNNTVRLKGFTPRLRLSHFYIIEDGLEPGDEVVYEGIQRMRDGMKINTSNAPMDSLLMNSNLISGI